MNDRERGATSGACYAKKLTEFAAVTLLLCGLLLAACLIGESDPVAAFGMGGFGRMGGGFGRPAMAAPMIVPRRSGIGVIGRRPVGTGKTTGSDSGGTRPRPVGSRGNTG